MGVVGLLVVAGALLPQAPALRLSLLLTGAILFAAAAAYAALGLARALRRRAALATLSTLLEHDGAVTGMLGELGLALREDPALQRQINRFARRTAVGVASRYGGQIVQLVSETVKRWDARTVSDRIEGAVGRDLQFIRLNGTLVGGLVGLLIHLLDTLL